MGALFWIQNFGKCIREIMNNRNNINLIKYNKVLQFKDKNIKVSISEI